MPTSTFDAHGAVIKLVCEPLYNQVYGNSSALVTDVDAVLDGLDGDRSGDVGTAIRQWKADYAEMISADRVRALVDPILLDMALDLLGWDGGIDEDFWNLMRVYQNTNSKTFQSRKITHGSWSYSGTGDGAVYWLVTNIQDREIETVDLTLLTLECVTDQLGGTEAGRELFDFYQGQPIDALADAGTGIRVSGIEAIAGSSGNLCNNPSFETLTGTAAEPTAIPSWTSSVAVSSSTFVFDSTNFFRSSPEETANGTSYALKIITTCTLSQTFRTNGIALDPKKAYFGFLRYNRQVNSDTGTLLLRLGSDSVSVVLSAQTGWNTLAFALDKDRWPINMVEDAPDIQIDWTRTGGTGLLIDDVGIVEMIDIPKHGHVAIVGGATDFLAGGKFTVTPALSGTEGKIQKIITLGYSDMGGYFHHADSTPTITDF